jgi:hypothetical protein
MNYAVDFNLITKMKLNGVIMTGSFTPAIAAIQNASFLSPLIDNKVRLRQTVIVVVHASLICLSALILIPLFLLLRKRLSLH